MYNKNGSKDKKVKTFQMDKKCIKTRKIKK